MEYNVVRLQDDGWTPALMTMALEVMNEFLARPAVMVILNSQKAGKDPDYYLRVKSKIENRKYASISNWIDDLLFPLDSSSKDSFFAAASKDLSLWIHEKTSLIQELSNFHFKSSLQVVLDDLKEANAMKDNDPEDD